MGYVVTPETVPQVAAQLTQLASNPAELLAMRERCHCVYHQHFSKETQLNRWDQELRAILERRSKKAPQVG